MTNEHKLPMGVSVASFAAAAIAVGALWTRVEVLADNQVSEARVVKIESNVENIKDDVGEIKRSLEKQDEKQDEQMQVLQKILRELGDD